MTNQSVSKAGRLLWLPALLLLVGQEVIAFQVQFYRSSNYKGAFKNVPTEINFIDHIEVGTGDECIAVQHVEGYGSLRTGGCVVVYGQPDCKKVTKRMAEDLWGSERYDKDDPEIPALYHVQEDYAIRPIRSLHRCSNEKGGGPMVNVDIYSEKFYQSLQKSYKDVNGCQNLPDYIRAVISIDNHGSALDFFPVENCEGNVYQYLPGGDFMVTREQLNSLEGYLKSFRPSDFLSRIELDASIFKFSFRNGTEDMINGAKTEDVKLTTDGGFVNKGAATLQQEFGFEAKKTETLEVTVSKGFSNAHSVKVEASVESKAEAGVPFIGKAEVTAKFGTAYEYMREDKGESSDKKTISNEETVTYKQIIGIPPCSACEVTAFLKKISNFPIAYDSYATMTGKAGSTRMTAAQVKAALAPEAEYLRDRDDYTVEVKTSGVLFAEYGLKSFVSADCNPIPGCKTTSKLLLYSSENPETASFAMDLSEPFRFSMELPQIDA